MHSSTPQPKRLGKYEITATVAVGPVWRIYKGVDASSQSGVVLKAVPKDVFERHGSSLQFQRGAREASSLQHPGIVQVYGCGEDAGLLYIVMEEASGWHLKERFRVPVPDAVNLSGQLLDALDYAHGMGIAHGAIKPSNLLLTGKGQLRIINFGIARIGEQVSSYMSPEQLKKLPLDRRSDIFSAGAIFYELLTGAHPFAGQGQDLIRRVSDEKERPPSQVNPAVPDRFDEVCAAALAKSAEARYATARAFSDAIRRAFASAASADEAHRSGRVSHETIAAFRSAPSVLAADSGLGSRPKEPPKPVPLPAPPSSFRAASPPPPAPSQGALASELKPAPKIEIKARPAPVPSPAPGPSPAPANVTPQVAARLEQILGKQPENLAGYLKDNPPDLDQVVPAFVATVRALIAMYEAKGRNDALIPQNIKFDLLGKATIRTVPASAAAATTVMGNPRYAAPEMFLEKGGSDSNLPAANVYALGVMFYEILLGRKLFEQAFPDQRSDIDWMRWHADLGSKAQPLKSLLPDCPTALSDLLEGMMEKHVEKRTTDLNEILTRLRNVAQRANKTVVLQRPAAAVKRSAAGASSPRKASWTNLFLFLVLLLTLGWVGYMLWQDPNLPRDLWQTVVSVVTRLTQRF